MSVWFWIWQGVVVLWVVLNLVVVFEQRRQDKEAEKRGEIRCKDCRIYTKDLMIHRKYFHR